MLDVAVYIDDDGNGYGSLGGCNGDAEQAEKVSFQLPREQVTVEYGEIDVRGIQHQFHRDEEGKQVLTGEESVHAAEHHHGTDSQKGRKKGLMKLF